MTDSRIELTDTAVDIIAKLSEGNPDALTVCVEMLKATEDIDPDSALGAHGGLFMLDTLSIYGSRIWILYKDVCGEDLTDTIAVLRGFQLGFTTKAQIDYAIDNCGAGLDVNAIVTQVKERLPNFVA